MLHAAAWGLGFVGVLEDDTIVRFVEVIERRECLILEPLEL